MPRAEDRTEVCERCGTPRPTDATSCPSCGAPVSGSGPAVRRSPFRAAVDRLRALDALGLLRRLVGLAALAIILIALAYAMLPFKAAQANCSPAVVQVFDRQRLTPPAVPGGPPGPPITAAPARPPGSPAAPAPKGVLKVCTVRAHHRLYYAGPVIILALIGSIGARRILS